LSALTAVPWKRAAEAAESRGPPPKKTTTVWARVGFAVSATVAGGGWDLFAAFF
jgi:hypothetical protein